MTKPEKLAIFDTAWISVDLIDSIYRMYVAGITSLIWLVFRSPGLRFDIESLIIWFFNSCQEGLGFYLLLSVKTCYSIV